MTKVDYLWIDGTLRKHDGLPGMRAKTKVLTERFNPRNILSFPNWGADGSSTNQGSSTDSDITLKPVAAYNVKKIDSITSDYIVLCEALKPDGTPADGNHRKKLVDILKKEGNDYWFGFEQEYVIYKEYWHLGEREIEKPIVQGMFYCGVGGSVTFGRDVSEAHLDDCLAAGLMIYGTNAEVMPGQWEFQIGVRNIGDTEATAIHFCDDLTVARYLLERRAETMGYYISFACKPRKNLNGSGCHTNFSSKAMREEGGMAAIKAAIDALEGKALEHIEVYGMRVKDRLTGDLETGKWETFTSGVADRTVSIRIPRSVADKGYGYLEDRRPGANIDPYVVAHKIIETVTGDE